jgi:uncharacterized membrane protein YbjE (DUF340 family)
MKHSLIYLLVFAIGILLAFFNLLPEALLSNSISKWVLYALLFCVGIQIGISKGVFSAIRSFGLKIMMIPLATTVGTFAGVAIVSLILSNRSLTDCLSVGAGFGYYSLSSILISEYRGAELGTVALLANIMREFSVLVFTPLMIRYFGKIAPICAGGATSMDATLPVISKFSGSDYVVIALFHGMIIDLSVPLWVGFFLSLP